MDSVPERARRVLIRLYSLGESKATDTDLQYRSGIRFCIDRGWAVRDGQEYSITVAGKEARESLSDFVSHDSAPAEDSAELPPGAYSTLESGDFVYIVDGAGQKIATLLGTRARKMGLAKLICEAYQHATGGDIGTREGGPESRTA